MSQSFKEISADYDYDALYRLTYIDDTQTGELQDYTHDPLSNRLTSLVTTGEWNYNADNQLDSYAPAAGGTITYQYDDNGNTTAKAQLLNGSTQDEWQYSYDQTGRLSDITHGGDTTQYTYDPFGRRISKTVNGLTTYYHYADEGLVAEYDSTGTLTKVYGYKPGSLWTTDPLYQWSTEETVDGDYYWYHTDHLGTPKHLTDETGRVVWSGGAEAYGETAVLVEDVTNNLRFPGQYLRWGVGAAL